MYGAEMGKAIKRSVIVILLLITSITAGYLTDSLLEKNEGKEYPLLYSEFVEKYSNMYGVPREIIYAIIKTESDFNPNAVSSIGAIGLMQLMPATFEWVCDKEDIEYSAENIKDPEINIRCGVYYLAYCYSEFEIWETAYAAYNAGCNRVKQWVLDEEMSENGHLTKIPYKETDGYVKKVSAARIKYAKILNENVSGEVTQ